MMVRLYILGNSVTIKNEIPQYELYVTKDDILYHVGSGPRLSVEHLKRAIMLTSEHRIIELQDINNSTFEKIMTSCDFEIGK